MNKSNSLSKEQKLPVSLSSQNCFSKGSKKLITVNEETSVFFNSCFDKGHVKELVSWFLNPYGEKPTINFVESLKFVGFQQATKAGISLGIEDLEIPPDRKSTRLNSSHITISYAVFCLKKKTTSVYNTTKVRERTNTVSTQEHILNRS